MTLMVCPRVIHAFICIAILAAAASPAGAQTILPGTIQFENFDQGAAGAAYFDTTLGNSGGHYRVTDVDIEVAVDAGGGYNVGWLDAREWLRYTVNVSAAGTYDFEVRVASNGAGGTFHIEVNGVDKTGALTIPNTGGWQTWTTIRRTGVSLGAGVQTWRVVMDTNGATTAVGNLNYIRVITPQPAPPPAPFLGPPIPLPGTAQAEDFDGGGEGVGYHDLSAGNTGGQYRLTGVDIEASSDTSGYNVGWTSAGEWLAYTMTVASAATYDVEVRVASNGTGGTFHIEVNGVDRTGAFLVPNTGGWQTWTTIRKTGLALSAGQQVWRLVMDADGPTTAVGNFNYIRVTPTTGGTGAQPFGGTAAVLPGKLEAEAFDNGGEGVAYHDLSVANSGGGYRATGVDLEPTSDTGGGYNLGWTHAGEWVTYSVNVGATATYDIEARVASNGTGGTFHIDINGIDRTGPFSIPNTGGWQTWATIRKTGLSLIAGPQIWRLVMDTDGPTTAVGNVNYIRLVGAGSVPPPPPPPPAPLPTTVVFSASPDHATGVSSYVVALWLAGTSVTVPPLASKDLGKPAPVNNDISADISAIVNPLPAGTYYAVVTAVGPTGSSMSTPSPTFTK